jgi:hypothetical protein
MVWTGTVAARSSGPSYVVSKPTAARSRWFSVSLARRHPLLVAVRELGCQLPRHRAPDRQHCRASRRQARRRPVTGAVRRMGHPALPHTMLEGISTVSNTGPPGCPPCQPDPRPSPSGASAPTPRLGVRSTTMGASESFDRPPPITKSRAVPDPPGASTSTPWRAPPSSSRRGAAPTSIRPPVPPYGANLSLPRVEQLPRRRPGCQSEHLRREA